MEFWFIRLMRRWTEHIRALEPFGEKNRLGRGSNLGQAGGNLCLWGPERFFSIVRNAQYTYPLFGRAGIFPSIARVIITAFLQLTRFMSFSMIFRALFARGRLSLVKGGMTDGSELKFEVPKVIDYFFTLVHFRLGTLLLFVLW